MIRRLLFTVLTLLPLALSADPSPWKVEFHPKNGLILEYENVPVIRTSTLAVVSPGWDPVLYYQGQIPQELEPAEINGHPALTVRGGNEIFAASYRLEALDENRFRIRFEGELLQDIPALIEYSSGYFNANLIAGVPFRGENAEGETVGRVPESPKGTTQAANDLLPGFHWLEFESRLGKLRLDIESNGERVMFFDARNDAQPWARPAPVFWSGLGSPARRITHGESVRFEMLITIEPRAQTRPEQHVEIRPKIHEVTTALVPATRPVQIIPTPKQAEISEKALPFSPLDSWTIRQPTADPRLKSELISLFDRFGMNPPKIREETGDVIEIFSSGTSAAAHDPESPWFSNPEGYRLIASENGIRLTASTAAGGFYGLQTLSQLMRPGHDGTIFHTAQIEDWPSMEYRGAHWFPSASGVPFHEKLIERIMARYKMNSAIIQCEAAAWDSHPKIAGPNSIAKEDLRNLVDLARSKFVDPIPLINAPGHAEWMFRNDQNLHFTEGPGTRYAYCVNHPDGFAFIQDILNETIDVFRPTQFHLGHDEVTLHTQFPHPECPRCAGETATDLVLDHLTRLVDLLDERGISSMIWGDMLLARDEIDDTAAFAPNVEIAQKRRTMLPEGITITDWHYYAGETYPSLQHFHEENHPTIASTWYVPDNIYHFAHAALKENSLGLLQTTWAGYFPDEKVLDSALHQFTAFILAAEYAWSGNPTPPTELPFEPGAEFLRSYYGSGNQELPGNLIDLSPIAKTPRESWHGFGSDWNFNGLGTGILRFDEILFHVPENFVVFGGRLAPETAIQEATIKIDGKAETVAFLNAAAFDAPQSSIPATITVNYSDGSSASQPLRLGRHTHFWTTALPALSGSVAWKKQSPAGTPIALRVTRWQNPHPEKTIATLTFTHGAEEQIWALAGLTLVGKNSSPTAAGE